MVKIGHLSLDGLSLEEEPLSSGQKEKGRTYSCTKQELNGRTYYIERENNRIETISTQDVTQVELGGIIVSPKTMEEFAEQNHGHRISEGFIFPSLNLVISLSQDQDEFAEVLVYAPHLKTDYEREYIESTPTKTERSKVISITPYESIGGFMLGATEHAIQKKLALQIEHQSRKSVIRTETFFLSFYDGTLGQVNIKLGQDTKLQIGDISMPAKDAMRLLLETEQVVERGFYYAFPSLGIALDKDLDQIIGFDERILEYWQNIHRPITSW
ncbi:hypothetical protein HMPREF1556_00284 [Porphyromonas sp. oral taxon 278 str. W7784]|jgi:hypothetical protein|uniref:hypothetical protein n=1 Tax=Porphyromonas sp. oral taxon 278 TaxID=712437 RepID=UPI0003AD2B9E|nr:hypothetical protein [Porphyromonas sp. oral taxon 278]ERJ72996.1 hypothetical protein HMPREF1556_00284 [Porphyromonas sp. oral taxon 278 str. W7784]